MKALAIRQALKNLKETGNFWGEPSEVDFSFKFNILNREICIKQRNKNSFMGRFGGGWNWKLGFQIGGSTIIFNLLTFSIAIRKRKP